MPYRSCSSCGLTVFTVAGHAHVGEECPRCGAKLDEGRRRLFEPGPGTEPRDRSIHAPPSPEVAHDERVRARAGRGRDLPLLDGIHHISAICSDARRNVDFYTRVLGLRLVKQTVNLDPPPVYHLYYGDETATPGSILSFCEFPAAAPGRAGAGMVHQVRWRLASEPALAFWERRLAAEGVEVTGASAAQALRFRDPDGLTLELAAVDIDDPPLRSLADDIPAEYALLGFEGVRAYSPQPEREERLLTDALGFSAMAPGLFALNGGIRWASYAYDEAPAAEGFHGAGTVHHVAWACHDEQHERWRERLLAHGASVTPILDRRYFRSVYFYEPRGVLFEIATLGPGFATEEEPDFLGEHVRLPP